SVVDGGVTGAVVVTVEGILPCAALRVMHKVLSSLFLFRIRRRPRSTLFPYTTLFRSRSTASSMSRSWWASAVPGTSGSSMPRPRSEEHTSELQSRENLVCRLLLEKRKTVIRDSFRIAFEAGPSTKSTNQARTTYATAA